MKVKELMELVGETRFNLVKNLMEDGMSEIQALTNENVTQYTSNLVGNQTAYNLPANLVQVKSVKIKDTESGYFCPIPRVDIQDYKEK